MLTVADVMTRDVVTIPPDMPVRDVAELLYTKGISGVPVVEADGTVLGMVSEADLISHSEAIGEQRHSWWLRLFADETKLARDYAKAHGRTARDVMTSPVLSVSETASVAETAKMLQRRHVKRLPVVRNGKLIGILTQHNLLQLLVSGAATKQISPTDRGIMEQLRRDLQAQPWAHLANKNIIVENGVVHFFGLVESEEERQALRLAAESVPGVVGVEDHLSSELHLAL